jgi:hypothetical protein
MLKGVSQVAARGNKSTNKTKNHEDVTLLLSIYSYQDYESYAIGAVHLLGMAVRRES